ncbi:MAG: MFS transporter [Polyangiaceae bacterium]
MEIADPLGFSVPVDFALVLSERATVLRSIRDRNIWTIYAGVLLLSHSYGVAVSLTPLRFKELGFTKAEMGNVAVWYALGLVLFSLPMGALIRKFSAKTVLLVTLLGYTVAVGVFPLATTFPMVALIRFLDGAFSIGVWNSSETALLGRTDRDNKAFVMSLNGIAMALGYVVGPLIARVVVQFGPMWWAYVFSAVLGACSAALVILKLDPDPPSLHEHHGGGENAAPDAPTGSQLLWKIKTSCLGTFTYGYFQASVVLFLPIYLVEYKNVIEKDTIIVFAFFAAGMLSISNFIGRLGDRHGHLMVIRIISALGAVAVTSFIFIQSFPLLCVAVFAAGATLASISPVSLALQAVIVRTQDLSRANAIYNTFFASGILLGPRISAELYARFGANVMLWHFVAGWAFFIVTSIIFRRDDPATSRLPNQPNELPSDAASLRSQLSWPTECR